MLKEKKEMLNEMKGKKTDYKKRNEKKGIRKKNEINSPDIFRWMNKFVAKRERIHIKLIF